MTIIVESGASKADWVCLNKGKIHHRFQTAGMNPVAGFDQAGIADEVRNQLSNFSGLQSLGKIHFYGAGCINMPSNNIIKNFLLSLFDPPPQLHINDDILAAALALNPGMPTVIGLMGTGSIAAIYDGSKITRKSKSLGYLISDEGSGYHLGREVLKSIANHANSQLSLFWHEKGYPDPDDLLPTLYGSPAGNREIAKYASILARISNNEYVENLLNTAFEDYFKWHILRLPDYDKFPLKMSGSIAFYFADHVKKIAAKFDLQISEIIRSPINGLIRYHSS